jgi:threonine synthase
VKEKIAEVYAKTGYVMDTHTAVAAFVADRYRKNTGDNKKTVVASTASPYKFVKSVMTAIDTKYETQDEMELLSILNDVSGVDVPNAIKEIMNAEVLHTLECDADKMEETVKMILG